jgi:hypothetical protein
MQGRRPPIPRHDPETIAAAARAWRGDTEKVATTSVKGVQVDGVALSSRYDKAEEYEVMVAMVDGVAPELRSKIASVFCDSKAQACYSVELRPCSRRQAEAIAQHLGSAANRLQGGHNGIYLNGPAGGSIVVDPGWEG